MTSTIDKKLSLNWKVIGLWLLRLLFAMAFIMAGFSKLTADPMMVQLFEHIGIGQWFRYVTGFIEIFGAVLVLIPWTGFWGGLLLTVTMFCAIATHLFIIGGNPLPAIILAILGAVITYSLRSRWKLF
jgi:putative oxidoreductase